ncbi:hypothetical protein GCM10010193_09030 [Kitasatospora atroaurantiaca]|uniref:Dephospho-CoA kinase n=1 Tax=Kitasatospora atroaurantiaca TaxID=285545 RepID=A0A561ERW6_9ACTN|nr:hypothetical protein [Kitasatospora atroaurantiaca]TWE18355.1 hypothetical protein FB465_3422 [Kitasatospora atroaurantiaca]
MTYPNIALVGRARSGKDTLAAQLVSRYAYTRIAFADPLRSVALAADPIVSAEAGHFGYLPTRLSDVVRRHGWEKAKTAVPEVRRTLQRFGQSIRDVDPNFWVNLAMDRLDVAETWGLPVVVTDCRYENEATALQVRGFKLVRVVRPGSPETGGGAAEKANREHVSETELATFPVDATVINAGSLADLATRADLLARVPHGPMA